MRAEAAGLLVSGALALGMSGKLDHDLARRLVLTACAVDAESLWLKGGLLGDRPFDPDVNIPPKFLEPIDDFIMRNCFAGVLGAVLELGRWANSAASSDATGITGLSTKKICPGGWLTIQGSGFGATQPAGTLVYVPKRGGGCREAQVQSWSDTAITIVAPSDIGPGCVGFVRGGSFVPLQNVTGEMIACFGAVGHVWGRGFQKVNFALAPCPPCLAGDINRIEEAGVPDITTFRFIPDSVPQNGQTALNWNVLNADQVTITGISGNGPVLTLPFPLPMAGSLPLTISGLAPVHGVYRLTAINSCGSISAEATIDMTARPVLSVTRIEVVQSIQRADNSVRLTANRQTAVRAFIDSGLTDGFNFGSGPNRVTTLKSSLIAENLDTGAMTNCGPPWGGSGVAVPSPNRDLLTDSTNFDVPPSACTGNVRFRVVAEVPGPIGAPPVAWTAGTTTVAFEAKAQQTILPFLISDPLVTVAQPTLAGFAAAMAGPAEQQPFAFGGFTFNPAIPITLAAWESLMPGTVLSWERLIARLTTMVFLFSSQPTGGVRVGAVPAEPAYPWGGMALPRAGLTVPSMIAREGAGNEDLWVHELGHAFGLLHMNCGTPGRQPAGPFDGRLVLTISDPGVNVVRRTIRPAMSPEAMTYCNPPWPSVEHWDHFYNSVPIS
ncbi:hypothetical protein [Paracoccus sp. (in: a-proteobacteria)]|uniref:hypothetical protein n=1 Tax=Paracoccus sp. TaxID=267 RepID=UPI0032201EA8